ncbi:zinc-ribbon domain-containing protein [uncultured Neglectibacter sp.]|uniref:zinc-ribbon domain-containing protein n=1 Tax=uncultured Neglectibacter sp. TaxID=1924108 RepID=UPI0034E01755
MGILDDVVINAKSAAEAVGKRAGQFVDASKLRINVAELNAEISKRYEALGEYVYESCRAKLADDAEAVGKIAEIDELKNQHAAVNKELNDKQNKVVCPNCGKRSPNTVQFCSNCGTKLVIDQPAAEEPKTTDTNDEQ